MCRKEFNIELIIVLDGLTPKYLAEQDKTLEKSKNIWQGLDYGENND